MTRDDALDVVWAFVLHNPAVDDFAAGTLDAAFNRLVCDHMAWHRVDAVRPSGGRARQPD